MVIFPPSAGGPCWEVTTALLPMAGCAALCSLVLCFIFTVHHFRVMGTSSAHLSPEFCENGPNLILPLTFLAVMPLLLSELLSLPCCVS